jgi:hypothetical protein
MMFLHGGRRHHIIYKIAALTDVNYRRRFRIGRSHFR